MTEPEQWAVELFRAAVYEYGGQSIPGETECHAARLIQRAFEERTGQLIPAPSVDDARITALEASLAEARRQALEEAARFICLNVQVLSSHEDHPTYWSARRNGNAYALEYAAAIRALKDSPPPPTVV